MFRIYLIKLYEKYIKCIKKSYQCFWTDNNYTEEIKDEEELTTLIDHPFNTNDQVIFY